MKMNLLLGIILLSSVTLMPNDIEKNMSYQMLGNTFVEYILKGKNEECSVTYQEEGKAIDSTCLSLTNSKGIKIYCTKTKKICKTEGDFDNFVNSTSDDTVTQISKILKDWVSSHNNNDMKLLSDLYAKELTYYGKKLSRKKCIKDKTRALKKYPNFHQSLDEIDYSEITPNIYKVTFNKLVRLKLNGKLNLYPSYLLVDTSTSSILVEGDNVTDANKKVKKDNLKKISISPKENVKDFGVLINACEDLDTTYEKKRCHKNISLSKYKFTGKITNVLTEREFTMQVSSEHYVDMKGDFNIDNVLNVNKSGETISIDGALIELGSGIIFHHKANFRE
jgi:hypothetical protein